MLKEKLFYIKNKSALLFLRLCGLKFKEAKTDEELEEVYRLRYEIYKEANYIETEKWPEGKLIDKYEDNSTSFLVTYWKKPIGTARIIFDSKEKFPTEKLFPIKPIENRKNTVEISRLGIKKDYRGKANFFLKRGAAYGLIVTMFFYSKKKGFKAWLVNMPEKLADSFKIFKTPINRLTENELTTENIKERTIIKGYFDKFTLYPYLINIDKV